VGTIASWVQLCGACAQVIAGLVGIPSPNCVIPQAQMHTKSLVTLKAMLVERNAARKSRLNLVGMDAKTKSQLDLASLAAVPQEQRTNPPNLQAAAAAAGLKPSASAGDFNGADSADSAASEDVLAKHGLKRVRSAGARAPSARSLRQRSPCVSLLFCSVCTPSDRLCVRVACMCALQESACAAQPRGSSGEITRWTHSMPIARCLSLALTSQWTRSMRISYCLGEQQVMLW
jgi:hypothetical protein